VVEYFLEEPINQSDVNRKKKHHELLLAVEYVPFFAVLRAILKSNLEGATSIL
jgi:hypothetical protein